MEKPSPKDDATLIRAVISEDPTAWQEFVLKFKDIIYKICDEFVGSLYAKELFSGYFVQLRQSHFRALKGYKSNRGTLRTYLICDCHSYCMKRVLSEFIHRPEIVEAIWSRLAKFYKPQLLKTIEKVLKVKNVELSPELSPDDLYHDLLIHLMENNCARLKKFSGEGSFSAWLKTVTTHLVLDKIREVQRHIMVPIKGEGNSEEGGAFEPVDPKPPPDEKMEDEHQESLHKERLNQMRKAAKELSGQCQLYLRLLLEGEGSPEIAEIIGSSVDEVYEIAEKTIKKLRTKMGVQQLRGKIQR